MSNSNIQIEALLLDYLEGNLDPSKKAFVERYLADHPELKEEFSTLSDMKLVPDYQTVYDNKSQLKKSDNKIIPLYFKYAVAAGAAILIGLSLWLSNGNSKTEIMAVQHSTKTEIKKESVESKEIFQGTKKQEIAKTEISQIKKEVTASITKGYSKQEIKNSIVSHAKIDEISNQSTLVEVESTKREVIKSISIASLSPNNLKSENPSLDPIVIAQNEFNIAIKSNTTYGEKIRKVIPQSIATAEIDFKQKIKDVNEAAFKPIAAKFINAFQLDKLKEALVPSSMAYEGKPE